MKIKAAVPVRNRERFIGAYLDMLIDFGVEPIVSFGTKPWVNHSGDEDIIPDRTEMILDQYFPNIKIVKGIFSHHKDSINQCIINGGQYDLMLVNDCDMFITRDDWGDFLEFVNSHSSYEVYSINFERMIQEYYYDWRYGRAALRGGDSPIVAMKRGVEFRHMTKTTCDNELVWDTDGPKYHHMRFCQKNRNDRKCNPPIDTKDYSQAPSEIVDRLTKWENILKTL